MLPTYTLYLTYLLSRYYADYAAMRNLTVLPMLLYLLEDNTRTENNNI
jgi:hypothetical protein